MKSSRAGSGAVPVRRELESPTVLTCTSCGPRGTFENESESARAGSSSVPFRRELEFPTVPAAGGD